MPPPTKPTAVHIVSNDGGYQKTAWHCSCSFKILRSLWVQRIDHMQQRLDGSYVTDHVVE